MERMTFPFRLTGLLILAVGVCGGCQSDRLKTERDSLWRQNQQLQDQLARTQSERDAAVAGQQQWRQALEQWRAAYQAQASRPAANIAVPASTAFDSIEGIETEKTADAITVRVPGDVLFDPGKVDLKSTSLRTLAQIAAIIKRDYSGKTIRVEGYTDDDPIRRSGWKDNLELSLQRAASVHRYMQSQGIAPAKMYAAGFGPARPRATKAQSRRVEIVVVLNEQLAGR